MDDLLTPVSTTYFKPRPADPAAAAPPSPPATIATPQDVLATLRGQPDFDQLLSALRFLIAAEGGFSIWTPTPESAQIVSALVGEVAQNYWPLLRDDDDDQGDKREAGSLFLECLASVAGLNALVAKLRALAGAAKGGTAPGGGDLVRPNITADHALYLDLTARLLEADEGGFLAGLWKKATQVSTPTDATRRQLLSEVAGLLAGGRLLSAAAEVEHLVQLREGRNRRWWAAHGGEYSAWLGRNVAACGAEQGELAAAVWSRGLRLGYSGACV
jgi:telomere length regulation protein